MTNKPTIAILGASADASKFGNMAVRAYVRQGYEVFPVNPKGGMIEGLVVYQSLSDVPIAHLDRITVYLPPAIGLTLLEDIVAKGCDELWLNPGSEDDQLVQRAHELGLDPIIACSIVDLGISPHDLNR